MKIAQPRQVGAGIAAKIFSLAGFSRHEIARRETTIEIQSSLTRRGLRGVGSRGLKATAKITSTLRVVNIRPRSGRLNLAQRFSAGTTAKNFSLAGFSRRRLHAEGVRFNSR